MFRKTNKTDKIDYEKVNDTVVLLNKILKILFFVLIVSGVFITTFILKQWNIFPFISIILKILTPLFIGFFIAWLFNPIVTKMSKGKMKRGYATLIVYSIFIILLLLALIYCVPTMTSQLNDFVKVFPKLKLTISSIIDNLYDIFSPITNLDIETLKKELLEAVMNIGQDITVNLPSKLITIVSSIISGIGTVIVGLVIGIYMLLDFDNISNHILSLFPGHIQKDLSNLFSMANKTLVNYIQGTLFIAFIVFLVSYIEFLILGVKAPLLFALFCGITNIIPYVGPFIGGVPVALVGFTESYSTGIFVIIAIILVQSLDGYILKPLLLGKGLKLHPVTIILALLVFGHFFGIIGMIFAMPIVATFKLIFSYYNEKYQFLKMDYEIEANMKKEEEEK